MNHIPCHKCTISFSGERYAHEVVDGINYCSLHKAAPELRDALILAVAWLSRIEREHPSSLNPGVINQHLLPVITQASED